MAGGGTIDRSVDKRLISLYIKGTRAGGKGGKMEARLAKEVRVRVFEGELAQCQEKVNDWFRTEEKGKPRRILDVSVADHAILVTYEVR